MPDDLPPLRSKAPLLCAGRWPCTGASRAAEDADDPEKIVRRVQEVSAVLYHLEQVSLLLSGQNLVSGRGLGRALSLWAGPAGELQASGRGKGRVLNPCR